MTRPDPRQCDLPDTAPDVASMLRKRAQEPLRPGKPQAPCDVGLFSDEADQLDLASLFRE